MTEVRVKEALDHFPKVSSETATAHGRAAGALALCPASAHPLIPVLLRRAWGSAPLLQLLLFGIDFHMEKKRD